MKHLAGRQGKCQPCSLVLDDEKIKVIELPKAADAKKDAKKADVQAIIDEVHIGEDDFVDRIEGSSLRTISDPSRPHDRWINLLLELQRSWRRG